uniref:SRR1 domain-containing protein n=1 Tax=Trichobilharzia regenti TaxID=157069 RepID=A0AA85KDD8_TRIRE|nr:unnamed protein product [Trichobilharzia regenti]
MVESFIDDFTKVSLEENESEGWSRVCSRKMRRKCKNVRPIRHSVVHRQNGYSLHDNISNLMEDDNLETLMQRFVGMRSNFLLSKSNKSFFDCLLHSINQAFSIISDEQIEPGMVDVLCLGLGSPAADRASLHQLVVLDLLLQFDSRLDRSRTYLYDPVFNSIVRELIQKLGMNIIPVNKQGCYKLSPDRFHFIILPHCAPSLLNNLLCTNWSPSILSRLVLFSNGWREIRQELIASGETNSQIADKLAYITALETVVVQLPNKQYSSLGFLNNKLKEYKNFECMRVQCFPLNAINCLPKTIWNIPPYAEDKQINVPCSTSLVHDDRFSLDLISSDIIPNFIDTLDKNDNTNQKNVCK